jgi:hypothetical protein
LVFAHSGQSKQSPLLTNDRTERDERPSAGKSAKAVRWKGPNQHW